MAGKWRYVAIEVLATAAIVLGLWVYTDSNQGYAVVPVPEVLETFADTWLFARFGTDVIPSLYRLSLGYSLAVALGISLGFAIGSMRRLRVATGPILAFLRAMPPVALLPIALVLLGTGTTMKVALIAFVSVWPILLNTADGVIEINPTLIATAKSYSLPVRQRIASVILPATAPRILTGMRTSLSIAVLMLVVSEMVASTDGIGFFVFQAQQNFAIADMWAGILLLGLIGYVLNNALALVERKLLFWQPRS